MAIIRSGSRRRVTIGAAGRASSAARSIGQVCAGADAIKRSGGNAFAPLQPHRRPARWKPVLPSGRPTDGLSVTSSSTISCAKGRCLNDANAVNSVAFAAWRWPGARPLDASPALAGEDAIWV